MADFGSDVNIPAPDPRIAEAYMRQIDMGEDIWNFARSTLYPEAQRRQQGIDALNERVINQNLDLSSKAGARADDAWDFYLQKGRPVVEQAFSDATGYDSASNIQQARTKAEATATRAFDTSQRANNRMLMRMGVNPNSGRFRSLNNQTAMQKALAVSGASNSAEDRRREGAITLRQQAGNLAQGFPAQSMGFSGQSGGFGTSAAGVGAQGANTYNNLNSQVMQGMGAGAGTVGAGAGGWNSLYGNQLSGASIAAQQSGANATGFGSLLGTAMIAGYGQGGVVSPGGGRHLNEGGHGGRLSGPGTGTSDSIRATNVSNGQPVLLSNGEFIIPKKVVDAKGREFFDKLIAKYEDEGGGRNLRSAR